MTETLGQRITRLHTEADMAPFARGWNKLEKEH